MEQKQRLFIYDRREVVILVLLSLMVAAFAFTLGVHLGKRVTNAKNVSQTAAVPVTDTLQDNLPNKVELAEQGHNAQQAADEELSKSLHEQVDKDGVRLQVPRQVNLPMETKSKNGGATTLGEQDAQASASVKYALQIGSYPSQTDADAKVQELTAAGVRTFVKEARVKGLGKRYRLFIGNFTSQEAAESAGRKYISQRMIDSYLVSKTTD